MKTQVNPHLYFPIFDQLKQSKKVKQCDTCGGEGEINYPSSDDDCDGRRLICERCDGTGEVEKTPIK